MSSIFDYLSDERPFACTQPDCEADFTTSHALAHHLRVVHGVKPFACAACGEKFEMKSDLFTHERNNESCRRMKEEDVETEICNKQENEEQANIASNGPPPKRTKPEISKEEVEPYKARIAYYQDILINELQYFSGRIRRD